MAPPGISLSLVLHNHQPVGNFEHVLDENHRLAYKPMLAALWRHPGIRVGLHYSGPLLEWLRAERPDTIELIGQLVEREQVELLGGGYYEPILTALPDLDRVGQLRRMADELETLTGKRPRGAWLAERVWEPDLPTALSEGGYEYTVLDDAYLRAAGNVRPVVAIHAGRVAEFVVFVGIAVRPAIHGNRSNILPCIEAAR